MFGINVTQLKADFKTFQDTLAAIPDEQKSKDPTVVALVNFVNAMSKDL